MGRIPLEYFYKSNDSAPEFLIFWFHGLGTDGYDFEPLLSSLDLPPEIKVRLILPHAPKRSITLNQGAIMRGWYDIIDFERENSISSKDVEESCRLICDLIELQQEETGVPYDKIFIGGFSQGGAMALHFGLRFPLKLRGILSLSGYFFAPTDILSDRAFANRNTSVFLAHGSKDPVVPYELATRAETLLQTIDQPYKFKIHQEEHNVPFETLREMSIWFRNQISQPK